MKITPLNQVRYENRFNRKLITFKGFDCSEDSFEIKRIYNIPCPTCMNFMIQPSQKDAFVDDCQTARGEELITLLSKYKKYYHDTERKVADTLMFEATKYSDLDILQLSQQYIKDRLNTMKTEQLDILDRISKISEGSNGYSRKSAVDSIIEKYRYIIKNENEKFNRDDFEKEINAQVANNHSYRKKLSQLVKKMPTVNEEELRFLIRYGTKSKSELAARLLTPSLATCEHIKPKSAGGKNNTENYLAQCQECNSRRNDTPFGKWIANLPNFHEGIKKYIQVVSNKIETGEISDRYIDYPSDIAKTIATETNGKYKIEVPEIILSKDAAKINFESKINQLRKSIESMQKELDEAKSLQVKTENSEQFKLYLEYKELEREKAALLTQSQNLKESQTKLSKLISGYYTSMINLRQCQQEVSQTTNPRDIDKLKNKILSLQKQINFIVIEEKEKEYEQINSRLFEVTRRLFELDNLMSAMFKQIDFSAKYQKEIGEVKLQLFELGQLTTIMKEKNEVVSQKRKYEELAAQKEEEIRIILEENKKLNPNDNEGNNIDEYNKMNYLITRADTLKDKNQKMLGKEFLDVDSTIFEFAKIMAQDKIEKLIASSEAVRHHVNLENVSKISDELNSIYASIEQLRQREKEFDGTQQKIDSMKSSEELNKELAELTEKLAMAKEIEAAVDIEQKIITLEKEIARKKAILAKVENMEMSEEQFARIFSEL